ncbi:pyridoxal phosphate biosynthesis protein [Rothia mucilaginosa DY-18]|uniref:Pyridoxal phosphate biosynthesis protein n=1 Tax=Rothia mucilaginosa (strain DY-18) TaxID=680646 RepID=D2NRF1_ROTMD|nr:pyridoxal phosphate biosynthesis protein [Rothia mucilaginosa DY-18]
MLQIAARLLHGAHVTGNLTLQVTANATETCHQRRFRQGDTDTVKERRLSIFLVQVKVNIVVVRLAEALSLRNIFGLSAQRGMQVNEEQGLQVVSFLARVCVRCRQVMNGHISIVLFLGW